MVLLVGAGITKPTFFVKPKMNIIDISNININLNKYIYIYTHVYNNYYRQYIGVLSKYIIKVCI